MEFRNLTPYPAMAFDALDQHDQRFHVVVMRLTFELHPDGQLLLAPEQTPLVTSDEYYGELNRSSVRQESDLAPYKPHTDVIVIADAHAPQGRAAREFEVAIKINGSPVAPELPPQPDGLNPFQPASPERRAQWRQECARLTEQARQGPLIFSKTLLVTGPREWRKRSALLRALSLFVLPAWKLSTPQAITTLPLRYEYAYGGENKILETEPAAARVNKKHRLPGRKPLPESAPDGDMQKAIAHAVYELNPIGLGFAEDWYLRATKTTRIGELAAKLDTVIVDVAPTPNSPDKKPSVVCVWRATVACSPDVRVLEARMLSRAEADALREPAQDPASPPSASQMSPQKRITELAGKL
jgi:hypothetical protein